MRRARSVTGPLRRAHPASGATWNVQVVRGKMSSKCLWHACRALSAGLLLMLLGAAMAVIGYYAEFLSVDQEIRGNATVSVKDEARGFHLNNLSYVGPIVMGFGGFIVVAACVMTFEARDSAAKVTPARPTALPRPLPRRGPPCAPARLDQLGVYRLPHVLPLPHSLPLVPMHRHRPVQVRNTEERVKGKARFGSAPDLRSGSGRATLSVAALRRPLRRYALSVDEPPQSAVSASAVESDCGSQSSLALDLHASGACTSVTLRVRDQTRRRPLARQQRLRDDTLLATPRGSTANIDNAEEALKTLGEDSNATVETARLSVESELRASSAPPPTRPSNLPSPLTSPTPTVISSLKSEHNKGTCITIDLTHQQHKPNKDEMEKQTDALRGRTDDEEIAVLPREIVIDMDAEELIELQDNRVRMADEEIQRQIELQIMVAMAEEEYIQTDDEDDADEDNAEETNRLEETTTNTTEEDNNTRELNRRFSDVVEVTGYPSLFDLNTRDEFSLERLQEECDIDIASRLAFQYGYYIDSSISNMHMEQEAERQLEEALEGKYEEDPGLQFDEAVGGQYDEFLEKEYEETMLRQCTELRVKPTEEATSMQSEKATKAQSEEAVKRQCEEATMIQPDEVTKIQLEVATETQSKEETKIQCEEATNTQSEEATKRQCEEGTVIQPEEATEK